MKGATWSLVLIGGIVAARALGVLLVGVVATGSMEPVLGKGSLFVAVKAPVGPGDIVVFQLPTGERVVHRAVERTPDGHLITQGDANPVTDQSIGVAPQDPRDLLRVPTLGGRPWAIPAGWYAPEALQAAQVALVGLGVWGLLRPQPARRATRTPASPLARLEAHHYLFAAAAFLLAVSPLFQAHETGETVLAQASILPTFTRVDSANGTQFLRLAPFEQATLAGAAPYDVLYAPDLPGAAALSGHGPAGALFPSALLLLGLGLAMRAWGR